MVLLVAATLVLLVPVTPVGRRGRPSTLEAAAAAARLGRGAVIAGPIIVGHRAPARVLLLLLLLLQWLLLPLRITTTARLCDGA